MVQWIQENWELAAFVGGIGIVNLFCLFLVAAKLTPSTTDDEWAARVGAVVAKVVKLTPTKSDDELLAKVDEIVAGLFAKK